MRDCGNTSYKLIKGRRCIEPVAEFGEMVLFKPPMTNAEKNHKEAWRDKFIEGIYLGTLVRSSENLVGTNHGVFKAIALRRRPLQERWCRQAVNDLQGCPQKPTPDSEGFRVPTYVRPELQGHDVPAPVAPRRFVEALDDGPIVRKLYVRKEDVDKFGPSPRCIRCKHTVLKRVSTVAHTDACRIRFEKLIADTPAGKRRLERTEERLVNETYRQSEVREAQAKKQRGEDEVPVEEQMTQQVAALVLQKTELDGRMCAPGVPAAA